MKAPTKIFKNAMDSRISMKSIFELRPQTKKKK